MKKLLVIIAATSLALACSSQKEPAQAAVSGLDSAVEAAKPDIQQFAADRLPAVNDAVDAVKAKLNSEDYAGVIADVQTATNTLRSAAEAAAARKSELATEWATFAGMPARVGQIKGKLAELDGARSSLIKVFCNAEHDAQIVFSLLQGVLEGFLEHNTSHFI